MDSRDSSRSRMKRDVDEGLDMKCERVGDGEEWDGSDTRNYRSDKPRKHSNAEEAEEWKKSSGDRIEIRKRPGGSARVGSVDEDEYDIRKELHAKQIKKEDKPEKKISGGYQERETESVRKGRDVSGSKGHVTAEEIDRELPTKSSSKPPVHESSQSKSRSKVYSTHDIEQERIKDRDSRYAERRDSSRDRGHGSREVEKSPQRRWDEFDLVRKGEDSKYFDKPDSGSGKVSDVKHGIARDRHSKWSWSPERVGRRHPQSGDSVSDNERNIRLEGKEREREAYRDDRSSGRESSWNERNKDREGPKDNRKRNHESGGDKDAAYLDVDFDHDINWDSQRQEREMTDNDKFRNRPGYRKLGRGEGAKTSLGYGTGNRSSDMIEIKPTSSFEYLREESGSVFSGRKSERGPQTDTTSATGYDQWGCPPEDGSRMAENYDPADDLQERYPDGGSSVNQILGRNNMDSLGGGRGHSSQPPFGGSNRNGGGPSPSSVSQPPFGNYQGSGNFSRGNLQGAKGGRLGRGGRGRIAGRDGQQVGMPLPMMGSPFGPLGIPPGPMPTLGLNMSPGPGPPMGLGVFIPQYPGPWPGARGVDMNIISVPHGVSPVPLGPSPPIFQPNILTGPNPTMYFNQQGPTRGVSPSIPGPGFNVMGTMGRGLPNEKAHGGWSAPRNSGPLGKAPSRGEQNDYSQNFVDSGLRPQNYIRELELTNTVEDYPKLRELIQRKDEIVANSSFPPMYYKCDLREFILSSEFFGTKFDVILVDPPWEEYVHRAPGVAEHTESWTFEEISNLKIEAIADTPSFIFLWVGDGVGLEQGRQCLRKWGFRRCEDICWVKTNKSNATSGVRHDSHTLFQHSKEHCLMGIKGTVRRSTDGHIIHANIDTDIVIAEESPYGSAAKPEDLYRIIEHFALGRRRIELFGEDHNIRSGWLTVGKDLSSSNFNTEGYTRNFCDKDGKVWPGGRNPPPGTAHLVVTTPEIEGLRPKSPQKNQQQQPSISLPQTTMNSANRRPATTSPQNPTSLGVPQEASASNPSTPAQWVSPVAGMKAPDTVVVVTDDKVFDGYGHDPSSGQANVDRLNNRSHEAINVLQLNS